MEIDLDAFVDGRSKVPKSVRDKLDKLFAAGATSKDAAEAVGVPVSYAYTRLNVFRNKTARALAFQLLQQGKANG